ncbi:MAG: hypothetical protein ACLQSR_10850, partial [Limisphaerales bacterium]
MSTFSRIHASKWHEEVPGARWFKNDLHLHTLDDHPCANLERPDGVTGIATDPAVQTAYARAFLRSAIAKGIEVLGLTPHAVKAGTTDDSSVVWRIVDMWNSENDDDGVSFREKIYAVFPGFEPNFQGGADGLHLLFLFDPEIGRTNYLEVFASVMGAITPWSNGNLQISSLDAKTAFNQFQRLHEKANGTWDYICLAPHAFTSHGLFALRSQVLEAFPHDFLAAVELKDSWVPEDAFADKPWLKTGLAKYRHALFHSSDAYSINNIGNRFTLLKLAQPRIAAVKQAFLANDSRLRIAYSKVNGQMILKTDLPDPKASDRPWLRSLTIQGGTSFFAGTDRTTNQPRSQTFRFKPDFTCVIGGRMSGKSTLFDGMRVSGNYALPEEPSVKADVEDRARQKFLSGSPVVSMDIRGPANPTASFKERWPARFYTQRELQKAVRDQTIRRQILFRLIPTESAGLISRTEQILQLDTRLHGVATELELLRTQYAEAAQAFAAVVSSKT